MAFIDCTSLHIFVEFYMNKLARLPMRSYIESVV